MSSSRASAIVVCCLAILAVIVAGDKVLHGQSSRPSFESDGMPSVGREPGYQYVGIEQTIARVDTATGKIEILSQRNQSRSSLLVKQSQPWEWREVKIREKRNRRTGNSPSDDTDGLP